MIPDAFYQNSLFRQQFVPFPIVLLLFGKSVTRSIQFDGKFGFVAIEIQIVTLGHALAAEFISGQPA